MKVLLRLNAALLVLALSLTLVSPAFAATLVVDGGVGCDDSDGDPFYCTIQAAIDAASNGDIITVAAGTYTELVTVNKEVTITGVGDEDDDSVNTILTWPAGSGDIVTITANNVTLNNLRIDHNEDPLVDNSANIRLGTVNNVAFNGITSTEARNGLLVGSSVTVDGLTVADSHFDGNREAWYFAKEDESSNPHTVKNVLVTNTTFNENTNKGIYVEKLEDAVFDGIEMTDTGTNAAYGFNNGIDINLKWAAYANITIQNSTFTNTGMLGTGNQMFHGAIAIKARDQGSYGGTPASLSGVTIDNVVISGGQNGIRFGEPHGANPYQAGMGLVVVSNSSITGVAGDALINETQGDITATSNWWGSADGPEHAGNTYNVATQGGSIAGNGDGDDVSYVPWLNAAPPGGVSFTPVTNGVLDYSSIQAAIDAAGNGDTITVASGTYVETLIFSDATEENLTIVGETPSLPIVDGGAKFANTVAKGGLTLQNLYFKGSAEGGTRIIWNANSAAVNDFSLVNSVLDGEGVDGRQGISGNLFGGSFTVTGTEFKDIYGFSVLDIDSSSDYSPLGGNGLPLTTVTFADNWIHDVDGSIALRGHTPTRTTLVEVYGNTWEDIGGNVPGTDDHWAAIEINHAVQLNMYDNVITGVVQSINSDGQVMQLWDIGTMDIHDNAFSDSVMGIVIFGGDAGNPYGGPWAIPGGSMYNNSFENLGFFAIGVDPGASGGPLDASSNWWNSDDGPSHASNTFNVSTQGEVLGDDVTFVPWLNAAPPGGIDFAPVTNGLSDYSSIQAAIDDAATGNTINAAAGTYTELVTVDEELTINGAGDGADDTLNTIVTWPAGSGTLITISADNITLQDIRFDHNEDPLVDNSANIAFGVSVTNITFNRITSTEARNGLLVGDDITVDGLTIDGSHFDGNRESWYLSKETDASNPHTVKNVLVTNTTFNDNTNKGIYAEKLEDAVFDNIEVTNSGTNPAYGFNNGIDINLKWAAYANITIQNSTVTDSGLLGSAVNPLFAAGITIKARDQGGYAGTPASLSGVTIDNVTVTGGQNGIRFGEPQGANPLQAAITDLQIIDSSFYDNVVFGLSNQTAGLINAEGTWWGDASGPYDDSTVLPDACALPLENPAGLGDQVSGCVDYSPWSGMLPDQVTLVSPAHYALSNDYTPTFDWNDASNAEYYQLQVSTDPGFGTTELDVNNIIPSTYTPGSDLASRTIFYWRVRGYNEDDAPGAWSATRMVRTALMPPTLLLPLNNSLQHDRTPLFRWQNVLGTPDYEIQISRFVNFSSSEVSETVTTGVTFTPTSDLVANRTYYWHVRGVGGAFGPSDWSEVFTFREAMLPPTLQWPHDGAPLTDRTPFFNWTNVGGASGYMIQISTVSNFSTIVKQSNTVNSEYTMPTNLARFVTYYWRVRANGTNGPSDWSVVRDFEIQ